MFCFKEPGFYWFGTLVFGLFGPLADHISNALLRVPGGSVGLPLHTGGTEAGFLSLWVFHFSGTGVRRPSRMKRLFHKGFFSNTMTNVPIKTRSVRTKLAEDGCTGPAGSVQRAASSKDRSERELWS